MLNFDNYVSLFTEAGFGKVVLNTVMFAVSTTLLAQLLAVPMAIVVVRTKLPLRPVHRRRDAVAVLHLLAAPGLRLDHHVRPGRLRQRPDPRNPRSVPWNLYSIPGWR